MQDDSPDDTKAWLKQLQQDAAEAHRAGRLPVGLLALARKAEDMAVAVQSFAEPFDPDNQHGLPILQQRALEGDSGEYKLELILGNENLHDWKEAHHAIRSLATAYRESAKLLRDIESGTTLPESQQKLEARALYWLLELKNHTATVLQTGVKLRQLSDNYFHHISRYPETTPWEEKQQIEELRKDVKQLRQLPDDELRNAIKGQVQKLTKTAPILFQNTLQNLAHSLESFNKQLPLERNATDLSLAIAHGLAPSQENKHERR